MFARNSADEFIAVRFSVSRHRKARANTRFAPTMSPYIAINKAYSLILVAFVPGEKTDTFMTGKKVSGEKT